MRLSQIAVAVRVVCNGLLHATRPHSDLAWGAYHGAGGTFTVRAVVVEQTTYAGWRAQV